MRKFLLVLLLGLGFYLSGFAGNILIYGPRLSGAPNEQTLAIAAGHTVTVVTAATWSSMTTAQFASYSAIIIPDDGCSTFGGNADLTTLNANKATWSSAITGKRFYYTADGVLHRQGQYQQLITNGINFVANSGGTGLYFAASCTFSGSPTVAIDFLSLVDNITIASASLDVVNILQPAHPTMAGITNAGLSNWGNTAHGQFVSYPPSLLLIATGNGVPMIIASSAVCVAPTITCPGNQTVNNAPGTCGAVVSYTSTATGSPAPTITYSFSGATTGSGSGNGSGSVFNVGVTNVTLTATNACGTANCSFTVTVNDNQAPVINCPSNISVNNQTGVCGATVNFLSRMLASNGGAAAGVADGGAIMSVNKSTAASTVLGTPAAGNGITGIDFTASGTLYGFKVNNPSGGAELLRINPATGALISNIATVTLGGNPLNMTDMAIQPVTNTIYGTSTNNELVTINPVTAVATYIGQPVAPGAFLSIAFAPNGTLYGLQTNQASGLLTINPSNGAVLSNTALSPSIGSTGLGFDGETGMLYASECCTVGPGLGNILYRISPTSGVTTMIGSFGSTRRVQDLAFMAGVTATDNCSGVTITQTAGLPSGSMFPVGVTTNTFVATDASGNTASCSFTVTVIDSENPVITCPADIYACANQVTTYATPVVTDNCSATVTQTAGLPSGSVFPVGTTVNTFVATDPAGNTASCSFNVIVSPIPTVNQPANQVVCNGTPTAPVNFTGNTSAGTICATANEGNSITLTAPAGRVITSILFASYGTPNGVCGSFTIGGCHAANSMSVVSGMAVGQNSVTIPANNGVFGDPCFGTPKRLYVDASYSLAGTTVYNWTNNNTSIGLAASGSGNIPSFIGTNTGNAPAVATVTVTATYTNGGTSCTGTPVTFTYTVNPTPTVAAQPNQTVCVGTTTTATFSGTVPGTVYNWTNTNTSIGLAASGTGNISFVSTNTTTAPITGTITVTPTYTNGGTTCSGTPINFTITVNPTPTVNPQANQTVCPGTTTTAIFSGTVPGTVYNWTSTNTAIGLAASGTGNISFTATNATLAPISGTITVTPTYTNGGTTCTGSPISFTITVNPSPTVDQPANQSICPGASTAPVIFTGAIPGTVFNWTNNNTSIGLGASGTGNIPSFIGVNPGTTPNVGTITVTPFYTTGGVTCAGAPKTFTITVTPNPAIVIVADPGTTICEGDPTLLTVRIGTSSPIGTLYTQGTTPVNGSPSQVFEPANTAFNSQSADDFIVPAGSTWTITQVTANGIGTGNPTSVNVFFYTNSASNLPGAAIASFNNVASFVRTGGNYSVTLPSAVNLTGGTYWVSIQVNMSFATGGQWFWGNFGAANINSEYAWQNPGGGFGTPCTSWGYGGTGCNVGGGAGNRNNIFSIVGSSLADGGPLPPGYTFLWSPAAGLSSTTTNPVAASPMNTTTYTVVVNTPAGCTRTASILITVNKRPVVTTHPVNRTNCDGTTATFTVAGTGTGLTYQWQVSTTGCAGPWTNLTNGGAYSGVNTAILNVNPVTTAMNGYGYRAVLSGACAPWNPPTNVSNCAILTVNPNPVVTVTPATGCGGVAGTNGLLLTASGANTYTWSPLTGLYTNAAATIPYTGGNSATVYAAPTALTVYTVTGTLTSTGCFSTATAIVNYTPPAPTVTPSSVAMCLGDAAVRLTSSSSTSTALQFCSGPVSVIVPDNNLAGSTNNITVSGVPAGCNVSNMSVSFNMNHTWDGDVAIALKAPNGNVLNLDYYLSNTGGSGATTGFVNTTISSTGTATLGSGANPYTGTFRADAVIAAAPPSGPSSMLANVNNWNALYSVPNGVWTLGMVDAFAGDQGTLTSWCINMTYVCGVPATRATWSPIAGLYNDPAATIPYTGDARDTVYARPTPAGVYPYQATVQSTPVLSTFTNPANIVINASGPGTPYPANLNVSGLPPTGVGVDSVRLTGISHTWGDDIDILLQSPTGQNVVLMSDVGGIVAVPNATYTFRDGAPALNATAANPTGTYRPTNNGAADTWPAPGPGAITQATPTLASFGNTNNVNGAWKLFVFDDVGGDQGNISGGFTIWFNVSIPACTSPARTVVVTVNSPTTVTTQPVNQTICTDKVATFTVVPGGSGPFSYQWQVSTNGGNPPWTNITNGGVYSGATTSTLTITAPPVSMSGYQYRVIVTGAAPCSSATSFSRILTVNPLPVVVITANRTSLLPGMTATLSSTVTPFAAQTYTWLRNGTVVGGNTATHTVNIDGLGNYTLRVTDINGCTNTSNVVTIKDSISGKCFIYPNPSNGQFQVRYHSTANNVLPRTLTVYDSKGDRVFTKMYTVGAPYDRMDVDMRAYGKGLYWVEIGDMNGNRITMCRVVIQ